MSEHLIGMKIPEMLIYTTKKFPNRPALMENLGNGKLRIVNYTELLDISRKLSSNIQKSGFKKGDHIALLGKNSIEWAVSYLAIQMAGCVVVPIDSMLRPQEIRHILRHSEAKGIFLSERFFSNLQNDEKPVIEIPYIKLEQIFDLIEKETDPKPMRLTDNDTDKAVIIYTSGTTGSPKGVVLTHRNILSDIAGVVPRFDFISEDVFLSVLPIHHSFEGTAGFLTPLSIGSGICYARVLRAKEILEDIEVSNATVMLGVPLLFEKFYTGIKKAVNKKSAFARTLFGSALKFNELVSKYTPFDISSSSMKPFRKKSGFCNMRLMISGGAAIRPEVVGFFNYFGIPCVQGYGLSETSPVLCVNPVDDNRHSTVGPAVTGAELKLSGNDCDTGELLAKGPMVFSEYFKNPGATKEAFTEDGWFKTGDLGKIDEDGYISIVGRAKNLIVTDGGKNIHPEEIEELLNRSSYISESLIVGKKTGTGGEEPFAIIVPDFDIVDTEFGSEYNEMELKDRFKSIIDKVNKDMSPYKRIKGFKIQFEELPKTSTRKVKRYMFNMN